MFKQLILLLITLIFISCQSDNKDACPAGLPEAIFHGELETVVEHQFERKDQDGTETLIFDDGLLLEVYQSGCETISQEFRFTAPGIPAISDPTEWIDVAAMNFFRLSSLDEPYMVFSQYAQAIMQYKDQIRIGEPIALDVSFFLTIDPVKMGEQTILRVILESGNPS